MALPRLPPKGAPFHLPALKRHQTSFRQETWFDMGRRTNQRDFVGLHCGRFATRITNLLAEYTANRPLLLYWWPVFYLAI